MTRASKRWIVGVAAVLVAGPAAIWWLLTPREGVATIERFAPDRCSAAVRLVQPEKAWQRHWLRREGPAPEDALRAVMEALGKWDRWEKKYGENGARLRLTFYQKALFTALGDEAWLLFGEWGSGGDAAKTEPGEVGLVVFVKSGGSIKSRVGPLMDLLLEEYQIQRQSYRGVSIYEYHDKKLGRSFAFCELGGWICASLRQRGAGPLPGIIDHYRDGKASPSSLPRPEIFRAQDAQGTAGALTASLAPQELWGQLRQFGFQRQKGMSKKSEERFQYWSQRLDGVEAFTLSQTGPSLLDLTVEAMGKRPALLAQALHEDRPSTALLPVADARTSLTRARGEASATSVTTPVAQMDLSVGLARMAMPLAGVSWEEALEGTGWLNAWPGLRPLLADLFTHDGAAAQGRIGVGVYPLSPMMLPGVLGWLDQPPLRSAGKPSAQVWSSATSDTQSIAPGDLALWLLPPPVQAEGGPTRWQEAEREALRQGTPLAYVSVDWGRLARALDQAPKILLKKKAKKKLTKFGHIASALDLAFGGTLVRLDIQGERWVLTAKTL